MYCCRRTKRRTHLAALTEWDAASLRTNVRRWSIKFQYFSPPLHSWWIARWQSSDGSIWEKDNLILTMSATLEQSWTVGRQGVPCTMTCARANTLVSWLMLSGIYNIKKGVNIFEYLHNYTYKFFDSHASSSEWITNSGCNFLPIRVVMFNACWHIKSIPLEYILKKE